MNTIVKQWTRQSQIREILRQTPMGMITENQRILNVCRNHPHIDTESFINSTNRIDLPGWGNNSEEKLSQDLSIFILRELLKIHDPQKVVEANIESPTESIKEIMNLSYPSLESLYLQRHDFWWKKIKENNRYDLVVVRITDLLAIKWPENYLYKRLSEYHFQTPRQMLKMDKFGKKKLQSLIMAIAWAALSESDLPKITCTSPSELISSSKLNKMEKWILQERFDEDKRKTLQSAGERFNLTRERIRQLEAKAIEKLRVLKIDEPMLEWLKDQAPLIWALLSEDNGDTVKNIGEHRRDYKKLPGEVELAMAIVDWNMDKLLRQTGECIGDTWYRKSKK